MIKLFCDLVQTSFEQIPLYIPKFVIFNIFKFSSADMPDSTFYTECDIDYLKNFDQTNAIKLQSMINENITIRGYQKNPIYSDW